MRLALSSLMISTYENLYRVRKVTYEVISIMEADLCVQVFHGVVFCYIQFFQYLFSEYLYIYLLDYCVFESCMGTHIS